MKPPVTFIYNDIEYKIDEAGALQYRLIKLDYQGRPYQFTFGQSISKIREMADAETETVEFYTESYKRFLVHYDEVCRQSKDRHAVDVF